MNNTLIENLSITVDSGIISVKLIILYDDWAMNIFS